MKIIYGIIIILLIILLGACALKAKSKKRESCQNSVFV